MPVIKPWQLARQLAIYRAWKAVPAPWLDSSLTDRVSVKVYEKQNFRSVLTLINDCMFGLYFLTTLDIYKDHFKGYQRCHKLHKCEAKFYSCKLWSETKFVLVLPSLEEAAAFVRRWVLWPSNFMVFIVWMNWRTLQSTSFSIWRSSRVLGSAQLVSHILGAMHWKGEIVTTKQVQLGIGVRVQL